MGTIYATSYSYVKGKRNSLTIGNVLYVENLRFNLLSVEIIESFGLKVDFSEDEVEIYYKIEVMAVGRRLNKIYLEEFNVLNNSMNNVVANEKLIDLWHKRLSHINNQSLKSLAHKIGINSSLISTNCKCTCIEDKQHKLPHVAKSSCRKALELIHSDLLSVSPFSRDNKKYV